MAIIFEGTAVAKGLVSPTKFQQAKLENFLNVYYSLLQEREVLYVGAPNLETKLKYHMDAWLASINVSGVQRYAVQAAILAGGDKKWFDNLKHVKP